MAKSKKSTYVDQILIKNVPVPTKETLKNIADNEGQTLAGFLKTHLKKIIESYPQNMRIAQE